MQDNASNIMTYRLRLEEAKNTINQSLKYLMRFVRPLKYGVTVLEHPVVENGMTSGSNVTVEILGMIW